MAAAVGDVDGGPGGPGRGLLQVRAGQRVAGLVLLPETLNIISSFGNFEGSFIFDLFSLFKMSSFYFMLIHPNSSSFSEELKTTKPINQQFVFKLDLMDP